MQQNGFSVELDRNKRGNVWSDLPHDLVQLIACRLYATDLLRFQSVCKNWNQGSSLVTSKIMWGLWHLTYGTTAECLLTTCSKKKHTLKIPELIGTTCIASYNDWLLLFKQGSMFFFSPFSRAKIDLPKFPSSSFSRRVALFSSPPTSIDCSICVVYWVGKTTMRLTLLHRGTDEWYHRDYRRNEPRNNAPNRKTFYEDTFYFYDENNLLAYSTIHDVWRCYTFVDDTNNKPLAYGRTEIFSSWCDRLIRSLQVLELCEGVFVTKSYTTYRVAHNKEEKGVWLSPRLSRVPPTYKWSS